MPLFASVFSATLHFKVVADTSAKHIEHGMHAQWACVEKWWWLNLFSQEGVHTHCVAPVQNVIEKALETREVGVVQIARTA